MSRLIRPRILVIGELNVDIVATGVQADPRMGTEILAANCELVLGSASAIFAAGLTKLGDDVTFVSQVGKDLFGDFCIASLLKLGISTRHVMRSDQLRTGATVAISGSQDRALITFPGAIASFRYEQLPVNLLKDHQHLHMTSYFLQTGLRASFPKLFRQARALGLTTSLDPNSDPAGSWSGSIKKVLPNTNILFVNEREALKLTRSRTIGTALKNLGQYVQCVVVKLGSKGAIAVQGSESVSYGAFKIDPVDTTGAGDSFDAGFVAAYLQGESLLDCLRKANACGAMSALKAGGTAGQPSLAQLNKFLSNYKNEN